MCARFRTEYVFVIDQNNTPLFVQYYYGADLDDSYRSDIYLENKKYCVHDLFLTDEVETEGEFLPYVSEKEWRNFLPLGPSENVATIISEAGLSNVSIAKLVFVQILSNSRFIEEHNGFVASVDGVQDFDPQFWDQALSATQGKTESVAKQEILISDWIMEQVQKGNFDSGSK